MSRLNQDQNQNQDQDQDQEQDPERVARLAQMEAARQIVNQPFEKRMLAVKEEFEKKTHLFEAITQHIFPTLVTIRTLALSVRIVVASFS